jgi:hypothetical protein
MTAKTLNEPHAARRGMLRNGNAGGDLSKVQKCGAKPEIAVPAALQRWLTGVAECTVGPALVRKHPKD